MNRTNADILRSRPARRRSAYTVVELIVGMTLLVIIMVAVALAMQGAADANAYGADKARSLTQATVTLSRMSTDIRRAETVDAPSSACLDVVLPDGRWRRYSWNGTEGGPLTFESNENPGGNTLVPEIVEFAVTPIEEYSAIQDAVVAVNVRVVLEVRYGGATTRLDTMIRPRRNIL